MSVFGVTEELFWYEDLPGLSPTGGVLWADSAQIDNLQQQFALPFLLTWGRRKKSERKK